MAEFVKAVRKDVLNESSEQLDGVHGCRLAGLGTEGDSGVGDGDEAAVGNADAMRVSAEIIEDVLGFLEGGLRVDVPAKLRDRAGKSLEALRIVEVLKGIEVTTMVGVAKRGEHLAAEHRAHRLDGEEERALRRSTSRHLWRGRRR